MSSLKGFGLHISTAQVVQHVLPVGMSTSLIIKACVHVWCRRTQQEMGGITPVEGTFDHIIGIDAPVPRCQQRSGRIIEIAAAAGGMPACRCHQFPPRFNLACCPSPSNGSAYLPCRTAEPYFYTARRFVTGKALHCPDLILLPANGSLVVAA